MPSTPSTEWKEVIAPDEAERYARYAEQFAEMQTRKSARFGAGRALHRKQVLALVGRFEVLADLPEHAKHGLFQEPARYEAWLRLSNGGTDRAPDKTPDIRGFALKVRGVDGPSALGEGATTEQDFLLINHSAFSFPTSHEFVKLVDAASRGALGLFGYFFRTHGFFGAFPALKKAGATFGKPFSGFATEPLYSAAPIAVGPYAARVRLVPLRSKDEAVSARDGWAENLKIFLQRAPLRYRFELQFFVDEKSTPIEDASVDWSEAVAPYVPAAELTVERQSFDGPEAQALAERVEAAAFDPWRALLAHRPLGDVMRARRVVYYQSQKGRGAAT